LNTRKDFPTAPYCGLPIGNLTSQIFANFYMNSFDHYIKHDLGLCYYGRYVKEIIIIKLPLFTDDLKAQTPENLFQ
jgi:hypothetical protein